MTYKKHVTTLYVSGIALMILLIYILGIFFPDVLWATHFLAFLSKPLQMVFLVLAVVLFSLPYFFNTKRELNFKFHPISLLLVSALSFLVFYNFQIVNDYYGDAKNFSPFLEQKITQTPTELWNDLFSIKLKTGNARWGVFKVYSLMAHYFGISLGQAFRIINALCGTLFIFSWLLFIKKNSSHPWKQICLLILGLTTPTLLIFCGHIEVYAFSYTLMLIWLLLCSNTFKSKNKIHLWLLAPLAIICFRFNTVFMLFLPLYLLLFAHTYFPEKSKPFFTLKKLFLTLFVPLATVGCYGYFFVFKDHTDPRTLDTDVPGLERLFLPLFSPAKPLDTYNLLSFNHFFPQ